jgi:hypothetical protein
MEAGTQSPQGDRVDRDRREELRPATTNRTRDPNQEPSPKQPRSSKGNNLFWTRKSTEGRLLQEQFHLEMQKRKKTGVSALVLHGGSETMNKNSESSTDGGMGQSRVQASPKPMGGNLRGNAPLDLSWLMPPEGNRKPPLDEPTGSSKQSSNQVGGGVVADPRQPVHETTRKATGAIATQDLRQTTHEAPTTAVAGGGVGTYRSALENVRPLVGGGALR